jgi:hypothetical protein
MRPDLNFDHHRVPSLRTYFQHMGYSLEISADSKDYEPRDLVTCKVGGIRPHIMIVSDRLSPTGVPFVIHNIGSGTKEEDLLFAFPMTGTIGFLKSYRSYRTYKSYQMVLSLSSKLSSSRSNRFPSGSFTVTTLPPQGSSRISPLN